MNMRSKFFQKCLLASLLLLSLIACSSDRTGKTDIEVVELNRENKKLTSELQLVTETLEKLEKAQGGFLPQQIVGLAVEYEDSGETLKNIQDRKQLRCGGNADLPGFGYLDPDSSSFIGFDIDFCRAIAAAVLGEQGADQIHIVPLNSKLRFAALQAGDIDVLTRNTTWTMSRDTEMRVNFAGVTFYDGQGILVRKKNNIQNISDLADKSICVQAGSTSESNARIYVTKLGLNVAIESFDQRAAAMKHYDDEACEAYTGDKTSLLAQRTLLATPSDHVLLHRAISREPLGPLVRHDDDNWLDIVNWTLQCMFNAELNEISYKNIKKLTSEDPAFINDALGIDAELGDKIGLSNDFCYQIVKQVGNYKDVYNRHLGPETSLDLPRGLNALYVDGGLHYPLPLK